MGSKRNVTMPRKPLAWLAPIIVVMGLQPARADWAYTHWGMSQDDVVAASNGRVQKLPTADRTRDDADHWELAAQGTYIDGTLRMPVGFTFDTKTGGLKCVMYNATGDNVAALRESLEQRYGKAAEESDFMTTHSWKWRSPDAIEFVANQKPLAAAVTQCRP
jgi:hypothetical protein